MLQNNTKSVLIIISGILLILLASCSNKKNTALTRFYHSVNTRYNIHFNAEEAYKETLKQQTLSREDNLSQMLYIFPDNSDSLAMESVGGSYTTTIDKATKAIKLHSIKAKPRRDPKRRNDAEYQAWLQQKEYTPFMDKVWLLLAKAEFQDGNHLRAITTFLYISKIYSSNPEIVAECQLWIARAYTEMGWLYESGNVLHKMELAGKIPEKLLGLYSSVKANYLMTNDDFVSAIPHLEHAIKNEKDKHQKLRMKYLLGQLLAHTGKKSEAHQAFASVQGMNTPYNYSFNAKLQQIALISDSDPRKSIAELTKMSKSSKNKEYLDQLYLTIGNIHLQQQDSTKAIEFYQKAIKESTRNGYDKTMSEITLANIYFNKREFISAQPLYSSAVNALRKSHPDYKLVSLRSEVLDELVIHAKTVQEQDSLQYIAGLPEDARLEIINKKIEAIKAEEERQKKEEERQQQLEEQESRVINDWSDLNGDTWGDSKTVQQPVIPITNNTNQNSKDQFYFYNALAVEQGKIAFQKRWGNRKLEDNWRRRDKSTSFSDVDDFDIPTDSLETEAPELVAEKGDNLESEISDDIYSVDYYLQQLPLTEAAIEESNVLIENALFQMGKIYKDKLEDFDLAIETFNTDISRFPQTPNLEEIYFQLFLIYMQTGNNEMMSSYRNRLISEFNEGKYAPPLSDDNYEWNFRYLPVLQDSLYSAAYDAYKQADVKTIRDNYKTINNKYPFTDLMPKFAFLNALSYAQTRDIRNLESNLKEVTEKYPKSDVTPLATNILERIKEGKIILSDGSPITDFDWSKAYLGNDLLTDEAGKAIVFSDSLNTEHLLLLMFKPNSIDRNDLLYEVADYNFSNYVIQTYDLSFDSEPAYDILLIKGFQSFTQIRSYINKALSPDGLINKISPSITPVPISIENYTNILPNLGIEQYMSFFSDHYQEDLPALIAFWDGVDYDLDELEKIQQKEDSTLIAEIEQEDEVIEDKKSLIDDKTNEFQISIKPEKKEDKKENPENDKQVTADDLLSKDQLEKIGEVNEAIDEILNNPVDGIKNLFKKRKDTENLTKEEKDSLKAEEKALKEHQKELKKIEKFRLDSIRKVEKQYADSVKRAEQAVNDSIKAEKERKEAEAKLEIKRKEEAAKATKKAKEDAIKQREQERKEKERQQKERLKEREKERKEKEKERERLRKEKEKEQKEKQRQREEERKARYK